MGGFWKPISAAQNDRKARGALKLESVEVKFDLSSEERLPVGVKVCKWRRGPRGCAKEVTTDEASHGGP